MIALVIAAACLPVRAEDMIGADRTAPPPASEASVPAVLSGTLKQVRERGAVTLGFRAASFPFSFVKQGSPQPLGYSVDLCLGIVDEIVRALNGAAIRTAYAPVTPDTRIAAVMSGQVDLECGSTTANAERRQRVAFSPLIFVAGTKLMVPKAAPVSAITDLKGKTIVVTKGTTNEQAIQAADKKFSLGLKIVTADDHEQAYRMVADGKADAFATDDVLLYGLIARHKAQDKMKVVGDYLSYEPYGIMFRKGDPQLAAVVERTFRKLATNHDLVPLYRQWFMQRLPTGERLGIAISPQLEESFKVLDASAGTNN